MSDLEADQFLRPSPRKKQEDYSLECIVLCAQDGDDAQGCETRWWAIVAEIEDALQLDVTIGGTLNQWATIDGIEQSPAFSESGEQRISEGTISIGCHHRK